MSKKETAAIARKLRKQAGAYLKARRIEAGLTQRELAERAGEAYYTKISQIESGKQRVIPEKYNAWADTLGVDRPVFAKDMMRFYDPYTYAAVFENRRFDPSSLKEQE